MTNFESFKAGMMYAAMLVENHWNDSHTLVNQKQQVTMSASAIRNHSKALTEGNYNDISEDFK